MKSNHYFRLALLFSITIIIFLGFVAYVFTNKGYLPSHEDETIYYNGARLFYETGSLKGDECMEEKLSIIFQANWYGIFYNIFYGGIAKIIGFSNFYVVVVNILLVLLSLLTILKIKTSLVNKFRMMLCFMMFNMVFMYAFTFFPETLNIFIGICLTFLLIKVYEKHQIREEGKIMLLYIVTTIFCSFFRVTWIFWLTGIFPFARNKNEWVKYCCIFVAGTTIAFLYTQFCCAPLFVEGGNIINELKQFHLWAFFKGCSVNIARNLYNFFIYQFKVEWCWMLVKMSYIFIVVYLAIKYFRSKNELMKSAAVIFLMNILVLFTLYISVFPYLMKITASIFILFFIVVAYLEEKNAVRLILIVLALSFPSTVLKTYDEINERKVLHDKAVTVNAQQVAALKKISKMVSPDKENVIQCLYYDLDKIPRDIFLTAIPASNGKGFPVIYTYNLIRNGLPYEQNFRTFNRLKVGYVISARELHKEGLALIEKNNFFYFYENCY